MTVRNSMIRDLRQSSEKQQNKNKAKGKEDAHFDHLFQPDRLYHGRKNTKKPAAMITNMLDQFKTGIPVHVSYPAADKVYFYVDKDLVAPIITMLYAQVNKIPTTGMDKDDLAHFKILKTVVNQLPTIMEKTTKFEAGLELIK